MAQSGAGPARWITYLGVLLVTVSAAGRVDAGGFGGDPDKFILSARARWWVPTVQGSFQINQKDYKGSYQDYRDELDMKAFDPRNNPGIPELQIEGRIGGHRLIANWLETSMQGDSFIERMEFNGKQYVNEHLLTFLDLRLYRLTYGKTLLDPEYFNLVFFVGVGYIDYRAAVEPDPISPSEPTHTGGNAPFPYIGGRAVLRAPVKYLRLFEVTGEIFWSRGDWGDARLFYLESTLALNFRPIKFVSLGAGFHFYHLFADAINVWSDDPDTLLVTLGGPYLELEVRF
ncbi:MAG: hypothetical protein ACYTFG_13485 [Planctomycetota bacterium]|jgi:hypothetical protein